MNHLGEKHTRAKIAMLGNKNWPGRHHTAETKAKLREARLGQKHSPEALEKMRGNTNRVGKKHTAETKAKIAATLKKRLS